MKKGRGRPSKGALKAITINSSPDELEDIAQKLYDKAVEKRQKEGLPVHAGEIIEGRKVPYTYADMKNIYPMVTYVPSRTIKVTVNGVTVQFREGEEVEVPKVFVDIEEESKRQDRANANNPHRIGMGGLEPEVIKKA